MTSRPGQALALRSSKIVISRAEQQLLAKQEKQAEQELQEKWRKESDAAAVLEREKLEAVKKEQENKPKNAVKDKIIRNDLGM